MPRHDPPPPDLARIPALLARARATNAAPGPDDAHWVPQRSTLPPGHWADPEWDDQDDLAQDPPPALRGGRHRSAPRVVTLPSAMRGARLRVSWRAVVALVLVLVCAGVVFAARVAWAEQSSTPQAVPRSGATMGRSIPAAFASGTSGSPPSTAVAESAAGATAAAASASATSARRMFVVDVVGQVSRPGVVSVPDGARLVDVLGAVGGALPNADLRRLNLARVVSDGEQIFVPLPGENPPSAVPPIGGSGIAGSSGGASGSSGTAVTGSVIDLNSADVSALDGLPGVGPVLAQRIVDWRTHHGRFSTVDELGEVSGIGDKLLGQLKPRVRV